MHKTRRVTIKDIARAAQVSPSTVSRSLNDSPLIPEATRTRIKEVAVELGFQFNASAQSLITRKTGTIGLIYPDFFNEYQYSLHLTLLMNKIRDELEANMYDLLVKFKRNKRTSESNIHYLVTRKKVDAFIIVHPEITQQELDFLHQAAVPFVLVQSRQQGCQLEPENWVFVNHRKGGYIAANHLITLGHRAILCLTLHNADLVFPERTQGYRDALADYHLPVNEEFIITGDGTFECGYNLVKKHPELIGNVDAIFSQTDIMALGIIEALHERGYNVPGDIAIVAYDDIEFGKHFRPKLTTIHQPREQLAILACRHILDVLAGKPEQKNRRPLQKYLEPYLIVRESCGAERM
jgi:LacI family transcriptional regulator